MRKILAETRHIDGQSAKAAKRVALALDISEVLVESKREILSNVNFLQIQIRDLQRHNLELQFLVDNPGFNVEEQLEIERRYIALFFSSGAQVATLYNRYDYDFFLDTYHPDYVVRLCTILCNEFSDHRFEPSELWLMYLKSSGFMPRDAALNFGPVETDDGII